MTAPVIQQSFAMALVRELGGRFSTELDMDVDTGDVAIDRWVLAATLFGTHISTAVAERTFHVLAGAGITRIDQASEHT